MKLFLDGILVVEGKEDASYLSNYVASEIVVVNGFEIPDTTISYLKGKQIILLLDPDEAGQEIRKKLNSLLPNSINVEIDINKCTRGFKKGVAECEIDEILHKLKIYAVNKNKIDSDIKQSDLYQLDLIGNRELRKKVCDKLNLGNCNGKTLYRRLLNNNISLEQLCEIIK